MLDLENDEQIKQLNALIQVETDPAKLALLTQQLLDLLDQKKSESETLT